MTRLESAIRRLTAQRDCLNAAAHAIAHLDGPVLELGLGNGRTYDHLRTLMPERRIYVFDRRIAAHPDTIPPEELTFLGEMNETLPLAARRLGPVAALVHADIGGPGIEASRRTAAMVGPLLPPLLQPGGLVLCDQPLADTRLTELPLPGGVPERRYFMYRRV